MILFIVIAVCILLATIFGKNGLIYNVRYSVRSSHPIRNSLEHFITMIGDNILLDMCAWFVVVVVSMFLGLILVITCPKEYSHWQFNINALQDNMGVEGQFRYSGRGYINDELSYYYSRTMSRGEIIEHIPADKTYIRYSDTEKPHVEVHQSQPDIPEWFYKVFFLKWLSGKSTDYYVIVAPEGTITATGQYEIDMR